MKALIISQREKLWQDFAPIFGAKNCEFISIGSLATALAFIRDTGPRLIIVDAVSLFSPEPDENLQEIRAALMSILMINAMVNTAVVSAMDEEVAHDALEGLGVMAMLPADPIADDIDTIFDTLNEM